MKFYYNKDGKNHGPVTLEDLQALAAAGEIQRQTPVIEAGKKEWMRWGALQDSLVAPTPAAPVQPTPAPAPAAPAPAQPMPAADAPTEPQRSAAAARPTARVSISSNPTVQENSASGGERCTFFDKVTRVYDKIDGLLERVCFRPAWLRESPEQCKEKLSFLNAIVGIGTLLCILCFCIGNAKQLIANNFIIFIALLVGGVFVQYVCYQMYSAMLPLLFGKRIKLSSLWLPRTLTLVSALFVPCYLIYIIIFGVQSSPTECATSILYFIGVLFICSSCRKLMLDEVPDEVVPGREFLNLFRYLIRINFAALHIITPFLMIISALLFLFGVQSVESGMGDVLGALKICILPIITLPSFYFCSFVPDFLESFFTSGDSKRS